jgi:hypothetical protein
MEPVQQEQHNWETGEQWPGSDKTHPHRIDAFDDHLALPRVARPAKAKQVGMDDAHTKEHGDKHMRQFVEHDAGQDGQIITRGRHSRIACQE